MIDIHISFKGLINSIYYEGLLLIGLTAWSTYCGIDRSGTEFYSNENLELDRTTFHRWPRDCAVMLISFVCIWHYVGGISSRQLNALRCTVYASPRYGVLLYMSLRDINITLRCVLYGWRWSVKDERSAPRHPPPSTGIAAINRRWYSKYFNTRRPFLEKPQCRIISFQVTISRNNIGNL